MNANINLLLHANEDVLRREKKLKLLNLVAGIFIATVGLVSLAVFILIQIFNPEPIIKQQQEISKQISLLQDRQLKLVILNNRIENIDKILSIRRDLSKATNSLLAKVPSQLSIDNFEIDEKGAVVSGQSGSLSVIGQFIANFTDMVRKKEIIKSLTLTSLTLDEGKNTYLVSIKSEL